MIQRSIGILVVLALMVCMASVVFARGGPPPGKSVASKAAVEVVTPTVANVPVLTGYDVIQNISQESRVLANAQPFSAVTTDRRSRSSTGDWRSINADLTRSIISLPEPGLVLLA